MNKRLFLLSIILVLSLITLVGVWVIPKWQYIAIENALHRPYELNVYDCDDYSKDLVVKLRNYGYNAGWVVSKDVTDGFCGEYRNMYETLMKREMICHAWVVIKGEDYIIPIESTSGLPMSLSKHNMYAYGTEDGNNEWLYLKK